MLHEYVGIRTVKFPKSQTASRGWKPDELALDTGILKRQGWMPIRVWVISYLEYAGQALYEGKMAGSYNSCNSEMHSSLEAAEIAFAKRFTSAEPYQRTERQSEYTLDWLPGAVRERPVVAETLHAFSL